MALMRGNPASPESRVLRLSLPKFVLYLYARSCCPAVSPSVQNDRDTARRILDDIPGAAKGPPKLRLPAAITPRISVGYGDRSESGSPDEHSPCGAATAIAFTRM